jgi:two-component system OmpR family response regulator
LYKSCLGIDGSRKNEAVQILIVEDDPDGAEMFSALLEELGHHARIARSGTDGLALAARRAPDAVFLDLLLPDMHGFDFAARLHQMNPAIPLVAVTGMVSSELQTRAAQLGFLRYLTKPYSVEAVEEILAELGAPRH